MKRIWIALGLIIAIVLICAGEQYYVKETSESIISMVNKAYGDPSEVDKLKDYWDERNDILFVISDHGTLDELSLAINQLDSDDTEIKDKLNEVKAATSTYYENQRVILSNIL